MTGRQEDEKTRGQKEDGTDVSHKSYSSHISHSPLHPRLGIMGGTFDPLHTAHLITAEHARESFKLDRVLFVPSGQPPHKEGFPLSSAEDRYAMALLGTADNPSFEVSRIELDRPGPSYSIDTIRQIRGTYGLDASIYFIVGADEALSLPDWHDADSLPGLARFIAVPRPGFDLDKLKSTLPGRLMAAIDMLDMLPMDISATEIRERLVAGRSIRYLTPSTVAAYIIKHGLYLGGE